LWLPECAAIIDHSPGAWLGGKLPPAEEGSNSDDANDNSQFFHGLIACYQWFGCPLNKQLSGILLPGAEARSIERFVG
jgi:hypothetical protein